jgi:hypothetical protein
MRALLIPLLLAFALSCSPAPPADQGAPDPSAEQPSAPTGAPNAEFAPVQAGTPLTGQWFFRSDDGVLSAGFGAPESEFQFAVTCRQADGVVTVMSNHELFPDQQTILSIIVASSTVNLPATSFNEGLPSVTAELDGGTEYARGVAINLAERQERFGVKVGNDLRVYPWSEELTRALERCQ